MKRRKMEENKDRQRTEDDVGRWKDVRRIERAE